MKIAVLGMGTMGAPMATNLIKAGVKSLFKTELEVAKNL
ncbi:MAG: hypothetical protein Ct9H300mP25_15340 [Acidobacteriota bacterium]|nr:MAG: hypothetical protein Ct9H300mP25_15340 [Acidobacteriota bacterium]